jgi:hypothetical protein
VPHDRHHDRRPRHPRLHQVRKGELALTFAKAIVPAALSLAAAIVNGLASGHVDAATINICVVGLIGSAITYLIPNKPTTHKP